ncbi:MAG TPA: hypothetical protein VGX28_10195 [Frankiaceae bacterium]|nr:hypothetical protein [Frankiaceae bacterium]
MTTYDAPAARRLVPAEVAPAIGTLAVAGVLSGLAAVGNGAFGAGLLAAQAVVVLAWLAVTDVDGAEGATVVAVGAALAADLLSVRRGGADLASNVGVLGVAFVLSLALQLARPHRQRVTDSLAGTMTAVVLAVFVAHLLATSALKDWTVAATGLLCAAAALVAGRVGDSLTVTPRLVDGARRGALGLLLALVAAAVLGSVLGGAWAPLSARSGIAVGVAAAVAAIAADLAIDLAHAEAGDERRRSALTPLAVLLPLVAAAPVTYAAARLLIG